MTDVEPDEPYLGGIVPPASWGGDVLAALSVLSTELGENRAHVAELRGHLQDTLTKLGALHGQVTTLTSVSDEVTALAQAVAQLLDQGAPEGPPRPVDLAHVTGKERRDVLQGLATWVRDVLFPGWPWTQSRLRPCWLYHPEIVNGLLWVRCAYLTAYEHPGGRAHHAADFHHWLHEVMTAAAERTAHCPLPDDDGHPRPPAPRDDLDEVERAARRADLAEIHRLVRLAKSVHAGEEGMIEARSQAHELLVQFGVDQAEYHAYVLQLGADKRERDEERRRRERAERRTDA
jgi:hypothetical protein